MNMIKMMFLCRWVRSRLLLYFGGETSVDDTRVIKDHLGQCSHCGSYSRKLSGVNNLVAACMHDDSDVPPNLASQVMNSIRPNQSPPPRQSGMAFWRRAALACLLVAIGFGLGKIPFSGASQTTSPMPSLHQDFSQSLISKTASPVEPSAAHPLVVFNDSKVRPIYSGTMTIHDQPVSISRYQCGDKKITVYKMDGQRLVIPALTALHQKRAEKGEECYVVQRTGTATTLAWCHGANNFVMMSNDDADHLIKLKQEMKMNSDI